MKSTELMIGDWVIPRIWDADCTPSKIVGIHYNSYREKDCVDWVDCEVWDELDVNDIKPIPLTVEILEKNGFEHKHNGEPIKRQYWIINIGGGSVKVKVNRSAFLFDIWGVPFREGYYKPSFDAHIQYIHEFQHALRLCGLNELADNFKI